MPKVTIKPSISSLNSIDVTITDESHTLAAPLVERMNFDTNCTFSAYKIGHPADNFVSLKIQGNDTKNAKDILADGLKTIIEDLDDILMQIKRGE